MPFTIEYSKEGNFRLSNDKEETDFDAVPADGITLCEFDGQTLLVTLKNYTGELELNTVYPIKGGTAATVEEDVDEEDEEEDEDEAEEGDDESDDDSEDSEGEDSEEDEGDESDESEDDK